MNETKAKYRPMILGFAPLVLVAALSLPVTAQSPDQEQQEKKFYPVSVDEVYAFDSFTYKGDYVELTASKGHMVLGKTEVGVTVVILLASGEFKMTAAPQFEDKMKDAFGNHPAVGKFQSVYMRVTPKDFEEMIKTQKLTKVNDEAALNRGKEIFKEKFYGSWHAGDLAIIPPERTVFMDLATDDFGQVIVEEGYWLITRRTFPYKSVYPRNFENPLYGKRRR